MHFIQIAVLQVMQRRSAVVLVVSATLVETDCDVTDGSSFTVDEVISTQSAFVVYCLAGPEVLLLCYYNVLM